MTLSLDEVRNIRFPMAREKEDGYRASSVDNFMDRLEISYAQLVEEIDTLRASHETGSDDSAQVEQLRAQLDQAHAELEAARGQQMSGQQAGEENERLRGEVDSLRAQLDEIRASSDVANTSTEQLRNENQQLLAHIDELRAQLQESNARAMAAEQHLANAASMPVADSTGMMAPVVDGVQRVEVSTSPQASTAVVRMVELAIQQAETLTRDAEIEARRILDEATGKSERVTADAQARAAQLEQETRQDADRLMAEARGRADRLDGEVRDRRAELFTSLEKDRDELAERVNRLRDYEENYRRTFTGFLQSQIEQLSNAELAEGEQPQVEHMFGLGTPQVSTPRLDALVAETRNELDK